MELLQQAIQAVLALYLSYTAPVAAQEPATPVRVQLAGEIATIDGTGMTEEEIMAELPGWLTYPDGAIKCVSGAPCDDTPGLTADDFTWNWETGVDYGEQFRD